MMKRIFALLLAVLLCLGGMTALSGCSSKDDGQTVGEWLAMVEDEFGMYNYRAGEPNALGLAEDDPYYETAQIADQWGLLPEDGSLDMDSPVTKEFAASTLAKVVGKDDLSDMSDEEIAQLSADKGYLAYDYTGKGSDASKELTPQEAAESIQAAKTKWLDRGENKEEISYRDGVHAITPENMRSPEYTYNPQNNELIIPQNAAADIAEGDSIVIPTNNPSNPQEAHQVQRIETGDGYVVIRLSPESLTFEDVYDEFHVKNSIKPSLQDMPVYDGTGRLLNPDSLQPQPLSIDGFQKPIVSLLGTAPANTLSPIAKSSLKLDFKAAGFNVTGEIEGSAVTFKIEGEIPIGKNSKFKSSAAFKTDFSTDLETDFSWGKLKYAYLAVNYTTEEKFSLMFEGEPVKHTLTQDNRMKPSLKKLMTSEFRKDAAMEGKRSVKICSIRVANGGLLWIDLDIKANITVSGGIELTINTSNTQGIEYINGGIRAVNKSYEDTDLSAKGKVEATLSLGPTLKAPFDTTVVGASIAYGLGVEGSVTAHLADKENILIEEAQVDGNMEAIVPSLTFASEDYHVDICGDITTYQILKIETEDSDALIKIKWELEIWGKDNKKINALCFHIEEWKRVPQCTRKYGSEETTTTSNSNPTNNDNSNGGGNSGGGGGSQNENAAGEPVPFGPTLVIDTLVMFLKQNEGGQILVKQIPYGYEMNAVKFSSSDNAIASVTQDGQVRAVKAGTATITVATTDQKYKATCSVTVQGDVSGVTAMVGEQMDLLRQI